MRYYDDLLEESFLLLRDVEQILTVDTALAVQVVSEPVLAFDYRISPYSAVNILTSDKVAVSVPDAIVLAINSALQTMLSYQSLTTYDPIMDMESGTITDLLGSPITSVTYLTDVQLIVSLGITVQNALQELIDTESSILTATLLANNALQELKTITPTLSGALNLFANSATQLLPTQQAYLARALLITISNALNAHIAGGPLGLTYEHSLTVGTALQEQITGAITASVAHNIISGNSLAEIKDDTAYLARAVSTLLGDSLQTISSDTLATSFAANLLADDCLHQHTHTDVIWHVAHALLLNTATQIVADSGTLLQLEEFLLGINDSVNQVISTSPVLSAIFSLLINDSRNLVLTDDAYIARQLFMSINNGLQQLDSDSIHFSQEFLLVIQNALQTIPTVGPRLTTEELATMVRDVLARGYYFFKARTKTKR